MSPNFTDYHHRHFDHTHTQTLPGPEIPYRTAPPRRFHSATTQRSNSAGPSRPRNPQRRDNIITTLDRRVDAMDKFQIRLDDTDRRAEILRLPSRPYQEPPYRSSDPSGDNCWGHVYQSFNEQSPSTLKKVSAARLRSACPESGGGRKENVGLVRTPDANRDPEMPLRKFPHQMDPLFAKIDRLLDMMESRMDAADRRLDNLRPPTQPEPKPPYGHYQPPTRRPTCWDPPIRLQQPYNQPAPMRQQPNVMPQQPRPRPSCWEPPTPAFEQPPYTYTDLYVPPRQYTTSTFRQPPCSSDVPPRNPHAEYHQWQPDYKPSRSIPPSPLPGHCSSAAPLPAAAAPLPPMRSNPPPKKPSPALPLELLPYATPGPYRPLQQLPVTTPLLTANPQAVVPSSMKKEGELLDDVPTPPAVFSPSCNPNISGKEESLLDDGVARERKIVEEEKSTLIMKETNLHNGDENGLMDEVMNCLHEVSYPSIMVYAFTCVGGSEITREVAWVIFYEVHHMRDRETDVVWQESLVKVRWKENAKGLFDRDDDEQRSTIWCAFDPGGDSSPTLLIVTLFIVSWFPP